MHYVVADEVSHDRTMFLVIHVCYVNVPTSGPCFLHIYVYHSDVTEVPHDRTMFLVILCTTVTLVTQDHLQRNYD